jgi:MYXO-CTERM domain-containing protein
MLNWMIKLLTVAVLLAGGTALAGDSPWHNTANPYDVDNNARISIRDFQLIVTQLQRQHGEVLAPLSAEENEATFYWDTRNDGKVTPFDQLLVVNQLMSMPTPEPSTLVTAGLGLAALAGLCWRRRQ